MTDLQQLRHDFPGFEVALQPRQAAGAEGAPESAADLRGHAQRLATMLATVIPHLAWDEHGLDLTAILKVEQELDSDAKYVLADDIE